MNTDRGMHETAIRAVGVTAVALCLVVTAACNTHVRPGGGGETVTSTRPAAPLGVGGDTLPPREIRPDQPRPPTEELRPPSGPRPPDRARSSGESARQPTSVNRPVRPIPGRTGPARRIPHVSPGNGRLEPSRQLCSGSYGSAQGECPGSKPPTVGRIQIPVKRPAPVTRPQPPIGPPGPIYGGGHGEKGPGSGGGHGAKPPSSAHKPVPEPSARPEARPNLPVRPGPSISSHSGHGQGPKSSGSRSGRSADTGRSDDGHAPVGRR